MTTVKTALIDLYIYDNSAFKRWFLRLLRNKDKYNCSMRTLCSNTWKRMQRNIVLTCAIRSSILPEYETNIWTNSRTSIFAKLDFAFSDKQYWNSKMSNCYKVIPGNYGTLYSASFKCHTLWHDSEANLVKKVLDTQSEG